jgi:hypothetical protein
MSAMSRESNFKLRHYPIPLTVQDQHRYDIRYSLHEWGVVGWLERHHNENGRLEIKTSSKKLMDIERTFIARKARFGGFICMFGTRSVSYGGLRTCVETHPWWDEDGIIPSERTALQHDPCDNASSYAPWSPIRSFATMGDSM